MGKLECLISSIQAPNMDTGAEQMLRLEAILLNGS